jgi:hypothetical protein
MWISNKVCYCRENKTAEVAEGNSLLPHPYPLSVHREGNYTRTPFSEIGEGGQGDEVYHTQNTPLLMKRYHVVGTTIGRPPVSDGQCPVVFPYAIDFPKPSGCR